VQYAALVRETTDVLPETVAVADAIGSRVRRWRAERAWTLDGLADRSGVSRRTLVGIEAGQSNPSISILLRLADAFGVGLADLVEDAARAQTRISRAGTAPVLWQGDSGGQGVLVGTTEPPTVVEHWDWRMNPGEGHESEAHTAETREIILVHEGRLDVAIGQQETTLEPGDSIAMPGDQAHAYRCHGTERVHFTMTVLQPGVGGGN
jgi:transcriptional regulator with XRE-family HTH domain